MAIRWESKKWRRWTMKGLWVSLHALFVGFLLALDSDLRRQTLHLSWIAACYYVLLTLTVAQFFYTSESSPGYVIDALKEDPSFEARARSALLSSCSSRAPSRGRAAAVDANNGLSLQIPLAPSSLGSQAQDTCERCHLIRPFRTNHCRVCDKCVLRYDHHCWLLGACIGQRNHHKYWWFLVFETLLMLWTAFRFVSVMNSTGTKQILILLLAILGFLGFLVIYIITLLILHTYLALTNQTTDEWNKPRDIAYLKNLPNGRQCPFSRGCASNVQSFCCAPSDTYPIYNLSA